MLVFKAHRLVYHSTPGLRVIKKKKKGGYLVFQAPLEEGLVEISSEEGTTWKVARA